MKENILKKTSELVNGLRTRNNYCQSKKSDFQRIHLPKLKLYRPLVVTKDIAQILECIVVDLKKYIVNIFLSANS